jgi:hypothetical protein
MYHMQGQDSQDYIKSLYVKSEYKPASDELEEAMYNFKKQLKYEQLARNRRRKPSRNVTFREWTLIQFYRKSDKYTIHRADKNVGPFILERVIYTKRGCSEHLRKHSKL